MGKVSRSTCVRWFQKHNDRRKGAELLYDGMRALKGKVEAEFAHGRRQPGRADAAGVVLRPVGKVRVLPQQSGQVGLGSGGGGRPRPVSHFRHANEARARLGAVYRRDQLANELVHQPGPRWSFKFLGEAQQPCKVRNPIIQYRYQREAIMPPKR